MPSKSNNRVTCLGVLPKSEDPTGDTTDLATSILTKFAAISPDGLSISQEQLVESLQEQLEAGILEYPYHLGLGHEALTARELTSLNPIIWRCAETLDLDKVSDLVAAINIAMLIDINAQVEKCLLQPSTVALEELRCKLHDLEEGSAPVFIFLDSDNKVFLGKPHTPVCTALLNPLNDLFYAHQALKEMLDNEEMPPEQPIFERCMQEPFSLTTSEIEQVASQPLRQCILRYLDAWKSAQEITNDRLRAELDTDGDVDQFLDFPNWPSLSAYSNDVQSPELQYAVVLEAWRDSLIGYLDDSTISESVNAFRPKLRMKYAELESLSSQLGIAPILTPQVVHASIWDDALMGGPMLNS
jgi:hypothetical protein